MDFQNITELKEQINRHRPIPADLMKTISQKFREEWTYHSNAIEGNTMTLEETSLFLREGLTAKGKTLQEHFEVMNHGEAIDFLRNNIRNRELSLRLMKDFHAMLFQGVRSWSPGLGIIPGAYKTENNHVLTLGGEIHYYTPAIQVPLEMEKLMEWFNISQHTIHPVKLATSFHHRFVAIHPFQDGNGRVGRLCMNFILMKAGYPPAIIKKENRSDYYAALSFADKGELEPLFELIKTEVMQSLLTMDEAMNGYLKNGQDK